MRGSDQYYVIQTDDQVILYRNLVKDEKYQPVAIKTFPKYPEITGTLHSGCAYDIEQNIFLFDEKNMYVIKFEQEKSTWNCIVYLNIYCIGI